MSGRKTVLIVDDDPGILRVLSDGLSTVLDLFDVVTAGNGLEAVQELERRPVDVLVTDLAMPVMDGFALIAYVTNQRSALPVVVLSGMVGSMLDQRLAGYGGLRVLRKPASYQDVAACVLEEIERVDRGLIEGIPLSGVLQLIEAERRSCKVVVTAGRRRGQLDFESGRLINAFSDDFGAEGEAAAYDILGWTDTSIEFEPLPANVRRIIHTPMQLLLVELASAQDRDHERDAGASPADEAPTLAQADAQNPIPFDGAVGIHADAPVGDPPEGPGGSQNDEPTPEEAALVDPEKLGAADDPAAFAAAIADDAPAPPAADASPPAPPAGADTPAEPALATVDEPDRVDDSILLDEPAPSGVPDRGPEPVTGSTATELPGDLGGDGEATAVPAPSAPTTPPATPAPPSPEEPDGHVRAMLAAIERLARRAKAADEALAAVASEIDAFREAQRRFDEATAQREQRRRDLERFRDEVAQLAREILGRVDGLFDAMASDPAAGDLREERPAT